MEASPHNAGMEPVTLIGQTSADDDRVAQLKPLITRDLRNWADLTDPPYRDEMWDHMWDRHSSPWRTHEHNLGSDGRTS